MKIETAKDSFHDNIVYFRYDSLEGDSAEIDFGDGQTTVIFPPRGQVTHQFDKDGKYTVKISQDGKQVASANVNTKAGHSESAK